MRVVVAESAVATCNAAMGLVRVTWAEDESDWPNRLLAQL